MRRDSSEISIKRVTLLRRDNEPVGGFLALGGADVVRCRKADTLAIIRDIASDERAAFLARMAAVRGLFAAPAPSEYYLSKMGVIQEARGARLGHVILEAYLESGETAGYRKFRLDVSAENDAAIKLYESAGFRVFRESTSTRARMTYLAMGLG
jgi:ribosomal protein S18 acetylase RimI-like enzyme